MFVHVHIHVYTCIYICDRVCKTSQLLQKKCLAYVRFHKYIAVRRFVENLERIARTMAEICLILFVDCIECTFTKLYTHIAVCVSHILCCKIAPGKMY